MFNKTSQEFDILFKEIELCRDSKTNKIHWDDVAKKLNKEFKEKLDKKQWKRQYELGKGRINKFGISSTIKTKKDKKKQSIANTKDILKTLLTKPKSVNEIVEKLGVDEITALGLILLLRNDGYVISHNERDNTYTIDTKSYVEPKEYNHAIGEVKEFSFLVIGDSHWCTKHQQKAFVNYIYDEAVKRGITTVYHVGDIVDGFYKNRPEHIYELFAISADEQKDYVVENWPKHEGITTYLILGNHDETHIKNGGFNIGRAIEKERPDIKYLGIGHAKIWLTDKCRLDLFHPLDGSSYAVSYSGQKYMDSLSGGDKPNILFVGHHHKALYFPYRNIHYFEVPSMTQQSSWMKRKRIANESGAWFVTVKVDETGTVVGILPEHIKQYRYLEKDY